MLTERVRGFPTRGRRGGENLRVAILEATRRLCFAEGVEGVTARGIARAVGCSATAIYLYYRNIDDVLHHLRMEGHALLAREFQALDPSLAAPRRIVEMGRAYYRFGTGHPRYYELMFLTRFQDSPPQESIERETATLTQLVDVVREGQAQGTVRGGVDPLVLANALWAHVHGLTSLAVSGLLVQTAPGQDQAILSSVLEGIERQITPNAGAPSVRLKGVRHGAR